MHLAKETESAVDDERYAQTLQAPRRNSYFEKTADTQQPFMGPISLSRVKRENTKARACAHSVSKSVVGTDDPKFKRGHKDNRC